jgi:ribosomal protein S18 acetylase RimI-like enzyme
MSHEVVNIKIEAARAADFGELRELWRQQWDYHLNLDPVYYVPRDDTQEAGLKEELRDLINSPTPKLFVARQDKELVGFVVFGPQKAIDGDSKVRIFGNVQEIFVRASARGSGAGKALLSAAEEALKEMGYPDIMIECSSFNDDALRFYEREGYTNRQTLLFKKLD